MIEPMLLKSCKEKSLKKYEGTHIAQEKFDGTRIIVIKRGDSIVLQTRSGKNDLASEYPEIVAELKMFPHGDFIIDSELVFFRKSDGKSEFLTGLAQETRKDYNAILMLFDVLEMDGKNIREESLKYRTLIIEKLIRAKRYAHLNLIPYYEKDFDAFYTNIVATGGEGIVLKKIKSIYKDGKRSPDWLKIKKQDTADCFVIGLMKGEGKFENLFGSLIMGQYDTKGNVKVVGATSGFDDSTRALLHAAVMKEPWFETYPSTKGELGHILHKVKPAIVIEISFMERLESGMFRHPRFERIREDKTPKDCVYE